MVKYKFIYENSEKTIKLTKLEEKKEDIFGMATLPPKMIQIELENKVITLTLVEMQVLPK